MSFTKLTSVCATLAFVAGGTMVQAADLPDPLELAQAADVCGGFLVESASYVDNFTNISVTCTTTPTPLAEEGSDEDLTGFIPLVGNLGPGGLAAFGLAGLGLIAGLTSDGDGGTTSDTQ
jgi:hypothetical protein